MVRGRQNEPAKQCTPNVGGVCDEVDGMVIYPSRERTPTSELLMLSRLMLKVANPLEDAPSAIPLSSKPHFLQRGSR